MAYFRKIILQCILLCAFISAPFAIADHQLSHLSDHPVVEQCELCLHSPTLTNFIETSYLDVSVTSYVALHFSIVVNQPNEKDLYTNLSRAPPKS